MYFFLEGASLGVCCRSVLGRRPWLAVGFLSALIFLVAANPCEVANHRKAKSHDEQDVHNLLCKNSVNEVLQVGSFSCFRSPSLPPTQSTSITIAPVKSRWGLTCIVRSRVLPELNCTRQNGRFTPDTGPSNRMHASSPVAVPARVAARGATARLMPGATHHE